ncbi:SRPBCC family protein [Nocardia gamkensis]|uniref:SRPBCC family protein n=1 Tax=Nocardia gamkensis TaxID=352869 RepID=UPI0033F3DA27
MELLNTFEVDLPIEQTWQAITDAECVIPCLPGAALVSVDGDQFEGAIKVKLGPVALQYGGLGEFLSKDNTTHSVVIRGTGKDTRGQGTVSVTITLTLTSHGNSTRAQVVTDLALSGRAAQFGRGVISDVSNKLLGQFVRNLEAAVADTGTSASGGTGQARRPASIDDVEPLDVAGTFGGVATMYLLPMAGAGLVLAIAAIGLRRQSRTRARPISHTTIDRRSAPQSLSIVISLVPLERSS